jgi:hypothetical protein
MKYISIFALLALMGCNEQYRYPCQDPSNWDQQQCKKPYCSANGTCPEDLTHYDKNKAMGQPVTEPAPIKGDCK